MDFHKDYYKILGVDKNANKTDIKAAYRKLSRKYHPDVNPGDSTAEEKMKEINEAKEILLNDITRLKYDEYKLYEEKLEQEEKKQTEDTRTKQTGTSTQNRKTYEKKSTIRKESKIYVKGKFTARFWAEQEDENDFFILKEIHYKLNPYRAEAIITETDIHPVDPPLNFQKAYSETDLFKSPIPQPVKCRITTALGDEFYDLTLYDLRVIDPQLSDLTKHEKQSLGTVSGDFYAYVLRVDEEEVIETVTECFGETGNTETKIENENTYLRKEYYHKDCSRYWGPWELISKPKPKRSEPVETVSLAGCASWWWLILLLLALIKWPNLALGFLGIGVLLFLFTAGAALLGRLFPVIAAILMAIAIYSAIKSANNGGGGNSVKRKYQPSYDTLVSTVDPITSDTTSTNSNIPDSLISHLIRWKDYDSTTYQARLSISTSALRSSSTDINGLQFTSQSNTLHPVYKYLDQVDENRLTRIYNEFDSIKNKNSLGELAFAEMVVSCIQSIPYYLVLDNSCAADHSENEFIFNFLRTCNRECCIGDSRFGLRTPVEFISDLKGDCDTRSLLIYNILKHFKYKVAILSSEYYHHAVIAVSFSDEHAVSGLALNINNQNYYLWETTDAGFRPGQIPPDNSNLLYWQIALLNVNQL